METSKIELPAVKMIEWFFEHWYAVETEKGITYVPSVTTYLGIVNKPWLNQWRGEIGNERADWISMIAKNKGSKIHHAWEILNLGGAILYESSFKSPLAARAWTQEALKPFIQKYGNKWIVLNDQDEYQQLLKLQEWESMVNPVQIEAEISLSDFDLDLGGTIDRIIQIKPGTYKVAGRNPLVIANEGDCLVDLKTGKDVWPENYLQLAGYRRLWEKQTGRKVAYGIIIHSNAKTKIGIEGLTTYIRTPEQMDTDWSYFENVASVWRWQRASDSRPSVKALPSYTSRDAPNEAVKLEVSGDHMPEKVKELKELVKNVEKEWK